MTATRSQPYAEDKGRNAALDYWSRKYWSRKKARPMAKLPENPFNVYGFDQDCCKALAWQSSFEATLKRLEEA